MCLSAEKTRTNEKLVRKSQRKNPRFKSVNKIKQRISLPKHSFTRSDTKFFSKKKDDVTGYYSSRKAYILRENVAKGGAQKREDQGQGKRDAVKLCLAKLHSARGPSIGCTGVVLDLGPPGGNRATHTRNNL